MTAVKGQHWAVGSIQPEPNFIAVDDLVGPYSISQIVTLTGIYTQTSTPIVSVHVSRSNDGGVSWSTVVSNVPVSGETFSIPVTLTGPKTDFLVFRVMDADNSNTFGITNIAVLESYAPAVGWNVANATPNDLPPLGGTFLTISGNSTNDPGKFPKGTYQVFLGPQGDDDDELCYPGVVGGGYTVTFKKATASFEVAAPKLDPGTGYKISVVKDDEQISTLNSPTFTVHAPQFGTQKHKIKTLFPRWLALGARNLESEP